VEEGIPRERIREELLNVARGLGKEVEAELLKLVEHLELDAGARVLRIGGEEIKLDKLDDTLNERILLALYRSRLAQKLSIKESLASHLIASAVREIVAAVQRLELAVELKHISIREELADALAQAMLERHTIRTFKRGNNILGIYCFDGTIFRECEADLIKEAYELVKHDEKTRKKTVGWVVQEALRKIRGLTLTELVEEPMVLAFRNVLLDWHKFLESGSLRASVLAPSPDIVAFHRIPHRLRLDLLDHLEGLAKWSEGLITNLEELAERLCPRALEAFKAWVGEKWPLLFEIVGYTLYPRYVLNKAVMLVGSGSNGKSTYIRLLRDILGSENVASVPLQDLAGDENRFAASQLYRKLANVYPDLPSSALRATGRFKALTGEDLICADRKYKDPWCFENYAKLIFSANELPKVFDTTEGFWRRWIVVEFPNQFKPDPGFFERTFTEDEIEGTIIVSLHTFRNMLVRRAFSFEGTSADYKEYWLRATDSVYSFLQDLLSGALVQSLGVSAVRDDQGRVDADTLYDLYTRYCELEDRDPVDKRGFTVALARYGIRRVLVHKTRYYKGLRLVHHNNTALGGQAQPPPD